MEMAQYRFNRWVVVLATLNFRFYYQRHRLLVTVTIFSSGL